MHTRIKDTVLAYWRAMQSNDFYKASELLAEDFECYWPQSSELIIGRENFAKINSHYPAQGPWRFHVNSILADDIDQVVTDVSVTDGATRARAITFHTVKSGFIAKQIEYWPESYSAPQWRQAWVSLQPA